MSKEDSAPQLGNVVDLRAALKRELIEEFGAALRASPCLSDEQRNSLLELMGAESTSSKDIVAALKRNGNATTE